MSILLSMVVHGGLLGLLSWVAFLTLSRREAELRAAHGSEVVVATLELPQVAEGILLSDEKVDPRGEVPEPSGGGAVAHVDDGRAGRGGEASGARATDLAPQNDKLSLTTSNQSHLDADQMPRIDTGAKRKSFEDRRSSREPMELTFLSQGQLDRLERRLPRESDPSRGVRGPSLLANVAGGRLGASTLGDELSGELGAARVGGTAGAAGRGVLDGKPGADHRESAAVAHARPDVAQEKPSVASVVKGKPSDEVDADQKVSALVHSLVHASAAGGQGGPGQGGSAGGGEAAAGGPVDFNTRDPRLMPYFRKIHAKIDPLWANAFPKSALYDLKQGTVILEFVVRADGTASVVWPPARPSGIDEFDRNCADAIRRASPFGPIPKELGVSQLRIRAPFEARNPIVK